VKSSVGGWLVAVVLAVWLFAQSYRMTCTYNLLSTDRFSSFE